MTTDELIQVYLENLYQNVRPKPRDFRPNKVESTWDPVCFTYGELLFPSIKKILKYIPLESDDRVLDLGAGQGQLLTSLLFLSSVNTLLGIEAQAHQVHQAHQVLNILQKECAFILPDHRKIEIIVGDFTEFNWEGVTFLYACSTCFTQCLLQTISEKINQTPSIKYVLSLRPLVNLKHLVFKKVIPLEASWDSVLGYVYTLKPIV